MTKNPTQGRCEDCKHVIKGLTIPKQEYICNNLHSRVEGYWTGCVMWEEKNQLVSNSENGKYTKVVKDEKCK